MNYRLRIFDIYEPGQRKDHEGNPHQEDSIFPPHGMAQESDRLFILCDGMGGHEAGEVASQTVCDAISGSILGGGAPPGTFTGADLDRAMQAAYDMLDIRDNGGPRKMGTTLALLCLFDGGACIAHIGDSRVYHIRPGDDADSTQILFRTEDHSLVNELIRLGELTEQEALTFPRRNVITRAMQPKLPTRPAPDVEWIDDIRTGDYFYLCSDGMIEQMDDRQLRFHFSNAAGDDAAKANNLRRATAENRDNHSAWIIHILEASSRQTGEEHRERHGSGRKSRVAGLIGRIFKLS